MALVDSIEKIVSSYFKLFTSDPFVYKDVQYLPHVLRVSENIFRGFTCPAQCGGCCFRFSLDYLPDEAKPDDVLPRFVDFNGSNVLIYSDLQDYHEDHFCNRLNKENGRCTIHGVHPFSCDFELLRAITSVDGSHPNNFTMKLYGRGWAFTRIDGERGAMCEIVPPTPDIKDEVTRKLLRLAQWMDHFGITGVTHDVIDWVQAGPHTEPAFFNQQAAEKYGIKRERTGPGFF